MASFAGRDGLLASNCAPQASGLAGRGGLGAAASRVAATAECRRKDRLVHIGCRRQPYSCAFGGLHTGPSPVDRARTGSKHHLITDSGGIPLAITLTGGNRNDVTQLLPLVDGVGPVTGKPGRPRRRAEQVLADRGYDHDKYRRELWKRGVKPVIARRSTRHGSGLGKERWVVERTFAWLHNLRRLRIRYERDPGLHMAFMLLGCAVVCQRKLTDA
jgi:transposase